MKIQDWRPCKESCWVDCWKSLYYTNNRKHGEIRAITQKPCETPMRKPLVQFCILGQHKDSVDHRMTEAVLLPKKFSRQESQ